jgi:putative ABC transport system permease protein
VTTPRQRSGDPKGHGRGAVGTGANRSVGAYRRRPLPAPRSSALRSLPVFEGVGIALDSLRANKGRAALTILGVAIGVTVVMVIAAMISGINKSVSDIFEQIAPRTFLVFRFFQAGVVVDDGSENAPWRRNPPITEMEVARIAALPSVRYVTSREESQTAVEFEDRRLEAVFLAGLSSQWLEVNGGDVFPGRTFTRMEDLASAPVAVINEKLVSQLFRGRDPIGQVVKIAGTPFTVIGVYRQPPNLFSGATPPFAAVPHGAFIKYVPYFKGWMRLAVAPAVDVTQQQAMDDVTATLRALRGLKPGQENTFSIVTQDKLLESWNQVTGVFFLVMLVLSSIGLMVGGVGVVAIMMISVTERTREIGVRKALGATRQAILWQFLVEASTLTLVGGAAGMLFGGGIAFLLSRLTPIPAHVPVWSIVAALAASAFTGVGFGLYPASRAARMDPVEALRYE